MHYYSRELKQDAKRPARIEFRDDPPVVIVDGKEVPLDKQKGGGPKGLVVLKFLFEANQRGLLDRDQKEAAEIFKAWHGYKPDSAKIAHKEIWLQIQNLYEAAKNHPGPSWIEKASNDDIKHPLSILRVALENMGSQWVPPERTLRLPPFELTLAKHKK
jgi:hypothetical protein